MSCAVDWIGGNDVEGIEDIGISASSEEER